MTSFIEPQTDTLNSRLGSQWQLWRDGIRQGASARLEDAGKHMPQTCLEMGASFGLGAGLSYAMKQGGRWGTAAKVGAALFTGLMGMDLFTRGKSLHDAFANSQGDTSFGRELRKDAIAKNLGAGLIDYSMIFSTGALGASSVRFRPGANAPLEPRIDSTASSTEGTPALNRHFTDIQSEAVVVISNDGAAHGFSNAELSSRRPAFNDGLTRMNTLVSELPDAYNRALNSVVEIWSDKTKGGGFLASKDGLIITDNHVVAGAENWNMTTAEGKTHQAKVLSRDPANDLAVLALIDPAIKGLPFLGEFADAALGDDVAAVSKTRSDHASLQVSTGEVEQITSITKLGQLSLEGENSGRQILLGSYPSFPGMSGAPIVRLYDGKVVGVVNGNVKALSSGFATPSEAVSALLKRTALQRPAD